MERLLVHMVHVYICAHNQMEFYFKCEVSCSSPAVRKAKDPRITGKE